MLVLELGGDAPSLRDSLARRIASRPVGTASVKAPLASPPAGQEASQVAPPVELKPVQPEPTVVVPVVSPPSPVEPKAPEPKTVEPKKPEPKKPEPEVKPKAGKVTLRAGQTLYRLAVEHLGDGQRWREIAALNGWSEGDLANLPANTEVKLPAR